MATAAAVRCTSLHHLSVQLASIGYRKHIFLTYGFYNQKAGLPNDHCHPQLWDTGASAPLDFQLFNCSGHFSSEPHKTLTLDSMWLPTQNKIQTYTFVAVYCMNFIIFLCVTLKLFSLSFVSLLAPNPGDASANDTEGVDSQ